MPMRRRARGRLDALNLRSSLMIYPNKKETSPFCPTT